MIFFIVAIFSCENDDRLSIPAIEGLTVYWDHEVFGDEGRRLRFAVNSTNEFDNDYKLEFSTSVVDKSISVRMTRNIDNGKCQHFPMPAIGDDDPDKCSASGDFYLPERDLDNGVYSFEIIMPAFKIDSRLTVTDEKVTLEIPTNEFLSSSIESVHPIPPDLLFGSIVYQGGSNTIDAESFLDYLTNMGLIQTTVPNYGYRHLTVNDNGSLPVTHWEPDNHSIGFLYKLNNTGFKNIFEESKNYFNQTNLNIYLYTSNGDQAYMSKTDGITVVYAKP